MKNELIFKGMKLNGIVILIIHLLLIAGCIYSLIFGLMNRGVLTIILCVFLLLFKGYLLIEPNRACALLLFGNYKGTVKENGFFFVNPFFTKKILSLRAHNLDVEPIKVNDKVGNPIMIGLVLVWKIENTYKALFDIDVEQTIEVNKTSGATKKVNMYSRFVKVQSDAALRKLAGMYAYDNIEGEHHELTLRGGGDEVNERLEHELAERLSIAGIQVIEARINYLAYASEIAGAMLRRQQATAIIAAREKIVEGAVSMVQLALNKLSENNVVELDDERKAAMVSNLMVVLCSEDNAQPVINTGTLYQ